MHRISLFITLSFFLLSSANTYAQQVFTSVDSFLNYAAKKSVSLQSGDIQLQQAKKAKLAAILSIPDVTGNLSVSYTDNTRLPVNLFPAEVFGGQPGTYKQVQTGVRYTTAFNENIDIKLVNPKGWENVKLAKLNLQATASDNQVTLKNLLENLATTYFNIITLQEQSKATRRNLAAADTLLRITQNKYNEGLMKQQDVNDAKASFYATQETERQIDYAIEQQYLALKVLADIPENEGIVIKQAIEFKTEKLSVLANTIGVKNSLLKEQIALSTYKQANYAFYPSLSFFQSYNSNRYSSAGGFFDGSATFIPNNYLGLKLSIPIPGSNTVSQASKAKYDWLLAQKNTERQRIQSVLKLQQLSVEYNKASSQANANEAIYVLRQDSYTKNLNLYKEGLMSLDQTLTSYNNMVNAEYNLISATVSVVLAKAKTTINNNIR